MNLGAKKKKSHQVICSPGTEGQEMEVPLIKAKTGSKPAANEVTQDPEEMPMPGRARTFCPDWNGERPGHCCFCFVLMYSKVCGSSRSVGAGEATVGLRGGEGGGKTASGS